uniref:hypothetical protein n=1 Tax=Flavobacterium sp. TaxID=239 RepID=UPI0040490992
MKKLIYSFAIIAFVSLSSFNSTDYSNNVDLDEGTKICKYKIYKNGQYVGSWSLEVPSNVECGSDKAKQAALATYNLYNS